MKTAILYLYHWRDSDKFYIFAYYIKNRILQNRSFRVSLARDTGVIIQHEWALQKKAIDKSAATIKWYSCWTEGLNSTTIFYWSENRTTNKTRTRSTMGFVGPLSSTNTFLSCGCRHFKYHS